MKRAAGFKAAEMVEDGMVLGLGSGSTVFYALKRLGKRIREESLDILGIPTSRGTEKAARDFGIPLTTLSEQGKIDLDIDGADEVDENLDLIKGGGGAHVREKIVATASARLVVIVDETKLVKRLGERWPVPVEVVPFASTPVSRRVEDMGARTELRTGDGNRKFETDNGNLILDCHFGIIDQPSRLERKLKLIPGVVDSGIFTGMTDRVVVGEGQGTRIIEA